MSHRDVAKRWADQQKHGRTGRMEFSNGSVSFTDQTIYSYHWWPMAHIIDTEKKIVLLRAERYSSSTSGHQRHVWHAAHYGGYTIMNVPIVTHRNRQYGGDLEQEDHDYSLAWFEKRIGEELENADRARRYRNLCMATAGSLIKAMGQYMEYFGLDKD